MSDLQVLLLRDKHNLYNSKQRSKISQNVSNIGSDNNNRQDYNMLRFYEINNAIQLVEKFV